MHVVYCKQTVFIVNLYFYFSLSYVLACRSGNGSVGCPNIRLFHKISVKALE